MLETLLPHKIFAVKNINIHSGYCHLALLPVGFLVKSGPVVDLHGQIEDSVSHVASGCVCLEVQMSVELDIACHAIDAVNDDSLDASQVVDDSVKYIH